MSSLVIDLESTKMTSWFKTKAHLFFHVVHSFGPLKSLSSLQGCGPNLMLAEG